MAQSLYSRNRVVPIDDATERAIAILIYEASVFLLLFILGVRLVARYVLPAQTREEHRRVRGRLWLYIRGKHGPAVHVKNGRQVASAAELAHAKHGPGVALVDPVSAIALEHEFPGEFEPRLSVRRTRSGFSGWLYFRGKAWSREGKPEWAALSYVYRWPGIVLKRRARQFLLRLRLVRPRRPGAPPPLARIEGQGIVFTEAHEIIREALDLRRQTRGRPPIKALTREGIEVSAPIKVVFILDDGLSQDQPDSPPAPSHDRSNPPFTLNRHNAFRAVYGTPVSKDDEEVKKWTDLPAFVASDIFRDMISTQTLDNLFRPTNDTEFPLIGFREDFNRRVQEEPVLRERGIRVIAATFGRLSAPDAVVEQRISSWQADWQRQQMEVLAAGDLQTARIIQRARANAQFDMVQRMTTLMRQSGSKQAVALRLFQALEAASADPSTRRLLPADTIHVLTNWLQNLRGWLEPHSGT